MSGPIRPPIADVHPPSGPPGDGQSSDAPSSGGGHPQLARLIAPVRCVTASEQGAAALLLLATLAALVWANWPWGDSYRSFWEAHLAVTAASFSVEMSFRHIVNDVLMTLFFFVVGLEVKREFTLGELSNRARAVVPVVAAIAGLVMPALIFLAFNHGTAAAHAWGVVISTDTAFLLGALAVAGPKFPGHLRVFLLALAVVDDVGALLVIAIFYTDHLNVAPLPFAVLALVGIWLLRYVPTDLGSNLGPAYLALAIVAWIAIYASGLHATLAGVAVALLIPVYEPRQREVRQTADLARAFQQSPNPAYARIAARGLRNAVSVNERLQDQYEPYSNILVLPIFALANAGVVLSGDTLSGAMRSPVTWGIVAGLVLGKLVGIAGSTGVLRVLHLGELAPGLTFGRIAGGATLSGIGFTIALFIIDLAIDDPLVQDEARVGVLLASVLAFVLGWGVFRVLDRVQPPSTQFLNLVRPVDPARDHIRGPVTAPLTLVEYGDFECPFCSRATGSIDEVRAHFGDDLRYVWRHLPLTHVHPHALQAAYASEAAARQADFFTYGPYLFAHQDALEMDDLLRYAGDLGLDPDRLEADMHDAETLAHVRDDMLDAELMDVHGTPTFFVNGKRHKGPYDAASLIRALDASRGADPTRGARSRPSQEHA
ncbi:MAG: Na+/H+ antiporter NhaA [Thermomicrobiales bacterium]